MKNRTYRKSIIREIKKSKARFISILAIIFLGVAFYSGIKSAGPDLKNSINDFFAEQNLNAEDVTFANQLLSSIRQNQNEINELISNYSKGYKFERLYSTDKCALTIAVCEMKYFSDIPSIVSIDEALTLVRKYSTEESLNFVNGILASLKKSLEV